MNKRLLKYFAKTFIMIALILFLIPSKASAAGYDYKTGYGGQLSEVQKGMYDAMVDAYVDNALADASAESAKYNCGFGNYVVSMTDFYTDVEYAFQAFIYDYPQVFWAGKPGVSVMATQPDENTIDVYSVTFSFEEDFEGARENISAYNEKIKAVADEIYKAAEQKVTANSKEELVYECYLGIHDWLCENLTYNYDALNDSSSYPQAYTSGPVFAGDASVTCQGYSEAFKALCDVITHYYDVELYAACVVGDTTGNARHMWNYAYMPDGNWYGVDVQWDDQDALNHTYFLCGSQTKGFNNTFAKEHIEKQYFSTDPSITYVYPVIAENAYELTEDSEDDSVTNPKEELTFSVASLTLQSDIAANFKVKKELFTEVGYENPYVVFEFNGKKTTVSNYKEEEKYYVFRFSDIFANQMNDQITATLYTDYNGTKFESDALEYSVTKYCYDTLASHSSDKDSELRTLLVDLLIYGAKAQLYTDYKTDELADSKLTKEQLEWATQENRIWNSALNIKHETVSEPTVAWKTVGLNLREAVTMRIKIETDSIDNLTMKVVSESGREWMIPSSEFVKTEGGYYVYFSGLNAAQMSEVVYLTVYNGNKAVSNTMSYSIETYVEARHDDPDVELSELVNAMMRYGDSAKEYVE